MQLIFLFSNPSEDLRCREKESYKSEDGHAKCVPDYMRTCRAWGNSHFYTLDGLDFAFQGTCTYTLVKSCGSDAGLVPFAVEEKNDNRGCPATSSVRFTNIHVYGHNISIHKGEVGKIRVSLLASIQCWVVFQDGSAQCLLAILITVREAYALLFQILFTLRQTPIIPGAHLEVFPHILKGQKLN